MQYQSQVISNRENTYKIQENEQEIHKLQLINNNLRAENANLTNILEKVSQDKKYISKLKEESEEVEERQKREINQNYQVYLSKILNNLTKIKSKYQQDILKLKNDVANMNIIFDSILIVN